MVGQTEARPRAMNGVLHGELDVEVEEAGPVAN